MDATDDPTTGVLVVAATERELCGHNGLVCGVGPVDAAAATARALQELRPAAVLNAGIAGGRSLTPATLVLGSESVYCDLEAAIPLARTVQADRLLLAAARIRLPEAVVATIGTSATVAGPCGSEPQGVQVEAMEGFGVLRAAQLAGVPALELRAISNEVGEQERSRWRIDDALDALAQALDALLGTLDAAVRARG